MKYNLSYIGFDLKAGLAVAAMILPFSVAYSEMLGLPPESGIFTAVFSMICYFLIGSSNELIIGPDSSTTALIASSIFVISSIDPTFNTMQFVVVLTITTGVLFFLAGLLRLGFIANFLSRPILIGFLNGVAFILIFSQLEKLTGVHVINSNSINGVFEFIRGISSVHIPTVLTGLIAFSSIMLLKKAESRIPGEVIIIIIACIIVSVFHLESFGIKLSPEVSGGIPVPVLPDFSLFENYSVKIIGDACAILFLTFTNTVLVGRSFSRDKYSYDANREFNAMGLADTVCGLFGGFPVSGASSRTIVNIKAGSKSKFSMLFAAVFMVIVVIFLSKQFALIPSAVFAAIISISAISIFNFKELRLIRNYSKTEFIISLICTICVMAIGVLNGILIAILLSFLNLIRKSSRPAENELVYIPSANIAKELNDGNKDMLINSVLIYRFNAAMLFYNFDYFRKKLTGRIKDKTNTKTVIIDAATVNQIDITFRNELIELMSELNKRNIRIFFYGANERFMNNIISGLPETNNESRIFFPDIESALKHTEVAPVRN